MNDRGFVAALIVVVVLGGIYVFGNTRARGNTGAASAPSKCPPPALSAMANEEFCRRAGGLSACVYLEPEP